MVASSDLRPARLLHRELAAPVELVLGATALFTTPPVVCYFLIQRNFVSGLTSGAIEG